MMDMASIAKEYVDLQKRAANNLFDAIKIFQNFADHRSQYWASQMGVNGTMKKVVGEWRVVFEKGREDSVKMVNDGFNYMESYLEGLSRQKKESQPEKSAQ
jgi:hypothetical protein